MGQNCLRDEVLALGQHGSRPSKRPARRPATVTVCFSALRVLGSREADPFREAAAPRKGQHQSRMHLLLLLLLLLQLQLHLHLHLHLHLRVFVSYQGGCHVSTYCQHRALPGEAG